MKDDRTIEEIREAIAELRQLLNEVNNQGEEQ